MNNHSESLKIYQKTGNETWGKISIIRKIRIIKTFGIPKFLHIMQSITLPTEIITNINRIFFRFIWKKKWNNRKAYEKVKRQTLCMPHSAGGLDMIDIEKNARIFRIEKS